MNIIVLLASSILFSCSSYRQKADLQPFDNKKVCSKKSLEYLAKYDISSVKGRRYTDEEIRSRSLELQPMVQKCYQDSVDRTKSTERFYICLVTGFDSKGNMEFFEFSSEETKMTPELKSCLMKLKSTKAFQGLKDVSIVQPFRAYVR